MNITALATAEPDDFPHDPAALTVDDDMAGQSATPGDGDGPGQELIFDPAGVVLEGELVDAGEPDALDLLVAQMPELRVEYVKPQDLLDNPRNLRVSTTDVEDLKASMKVVGVLCPLVVMPVSDTQFMIMIGHRRKQAAIELGFPRVPCVIAPDEGAAILIIAQLAENGHRVGLSATEEAEGYHQLTLLDWTPDRIAKVRHVSTKQVQQSLKLRALPQAARDAADAGKLTLDDAATMATFADQPAAMTRILKSAGSSWNFRHAVATERAKQDYEEAKKRLKAELILAGVKITPRPKGWPYDGPAKAASALVDADGQRLDVAQVRTQPGFAAFIEKFYNTVHAVVYCADPAEYGYLPYTATRRATEMEQQRVERELAEQQRAVLQEALQVAAGVRTEFYRQTYHATRVIKRIFPDALRAAVTGVNLGAYDVDNLYADLGGVSDEALQEAKEDRLRRCLAAQYVSYQERNLRRASEGSFDYLDDDAAAAWLTQLVADGYALSDAETKLLEDITADPDDEQSDLDGEQDDSDEQDGGDDPEEWRDTADQFEDHTDALDAAGDLDDDDWDGTVGADGDQLDDSTLTVADAAVLVDEGTAPVA